MTFQLILTPSLQSELFMYTNERLPIDPVLISQSDVFFKTKSLMLEGMDSFMGISLLLIMRSSNSTS
jgi:hypothetical protein